MSRSVATLKSEKKKRASGRLLSLRNPLIAMMAILAVCLAVAYAGAQPPENSPPESSSPESNPPEKRNGSWAPRPGSDLDDPSHFTGPLIEPIPEGLPEANEGSFEGGRTGTATDAGDSNSLLLARQRDDGEWNMPTNGPPSPLFGAGEYTQQMIRFEEFGTRPVGSGSGGILTTFPAPPDAYSPPDGTALDTFLAQDTLTPTPSIFSNTMDENPWRAEIEEYLERPLVTPPAEGRPPGEGWSHQRWDEFTPEVWFQSAMAGSPATARPRVTAMPTLSTSRGSSGTIVGPCSSPAMTRSTPTPAT